MKTKTILLIGAGLCAIAGIAYYMNNKEKFSNYSYKLFIQIGSHAYCR